VLRCKQDKEVITVSGIKLTIKVTKFAHFQKNLNSNNGFN
jgi:hypothetical protein